MIFFPAPKIFLLKNSKKEEKSYQINTNHGADEG